jgi:hypothetical protein
MRLGMAAASLVLGLTITASAQAQTVQASNWPEAIDKTDCKNVHNENGIWSLKGTVIVDGRSYGPSLPADAAGLLQKKCGCPHTLGTMGVGC